MERMIGGELARHAPNPYQKTPKVGKFPPKKSEQSPAGPSRIQKSDQLLKELEI
jgi:hypothetical protein